MATPILTLTGIDEKTEPSWINAMARTFKKPSMAPALEFAILRSPKIDASPRYPGRDAIKRGLGSPSRPSRNGRTRNA